jgi:hypothetical protein
MPRYYIDVRDQDGLIPDQEGKDYIDLGAALEEARVSACDVVRQWSRRSRQATQVWKCAMNMAK